MNTKTACLTLETLICSLLLIILPAAFAACGKSTDDTMTHEDSLRIARIKDLIKKDEVHRITQEYDAYFATERPHCSHDDLEHYRCYAWYLLCDNQNARALQVVLHADSVAHATDDDYMKVCFAYDIARYRNVDDIEGALAGMKEAARQMEDYMGKKYSDSANGKGKNGAGEDAECLQRDVKTLLSMYTGIIFYERKPAQMAKYIELTEVACRKLEGWDDESQHVYVRFHLELNKLNYYVMCDEMEQAAEAYERMGRCSVSQTSYGMAQMAEAACKIGLYEVSIPMLEAERDSMERLMPNVQISENYVAVLEHLADCYAHVGRSEMAEECNYRARECTDSINLHHSHERTQQLTEQFNTRRREYELQMAEAEGMVYKVLFGMTLLLMIVCVVATIIVMRYNRIIRRKNIVLAKNMSGGEAPRPSLQKRGVDTTSSAGSSLAVVTSPLPQGQGVGPEGQGGGLLADAVDPTVVASVHSFIKEVTERQLYCNADFDRDTLLAELHIQKTGFAHNFEAVTGQTVAKFVLNLRLEHAARLIPQHPEYTIEAIAAECGLPSRSTFYRNFLDRFGITPTEYRKIIS